MAQAILNIKFCQMTWENIKDLAASGYALSKASGCRHEQDRHYKAGWQVSTDFETTPTLAMTQRQSNE